MEQPPSCDRPSRNAPVETVFMDPLEGKEWDRMVTSHPDRSLFHQSAWAKVLYRTYGHKPFYFSCREGGRLVALVPMMEVKSRLTGTRGVCLPFADSCAPLFFSGEARESGMVAGTLRSLAAERGWKHWELRGADAGGDAPVHTSFLGHTLSLMDGPDALFRRFDPAVRRAIRKAERSGVTVSIKKDREAMLTYFDLHTRTRRRHGLPPQPLAFFLNIQQEIIEAGFGSVVIATAGDRPVAGAVFFHEGTRALYKFGASDERGADLRANNLVMWAGIQSLCAGGIEVLEFGRTALEHEGLRRYKLGWTTTETVIPYHRSHTPAKNRTPGRKTGFHAPTALFSRLPLSLNRLLGRLLYPHLD